MKIKIILSIIILTLISCKKDNKNTIFNVKEGKHCFAQTIENKIKKEDQTITELNKLVLDIVVEENKVHGNFDYIPSQGKTNNGNFTGVLEGNIAKTICVFNQEGISKKEEVIFKIEANKISILGGEKEKIDDVWKFIDASKGFYMNEITRTDCN